MRKEDDKERSHHCYVLPKKGIMLLYPMAEDKKLRMETSLNSNASDWLKWARVSI
jgi:hypothetical protein